MTLVLLISQMQLIKGTKNLELNFNSEFRSVVLSAISDSTRNLSMLENPMLEKLGQKSSHLILLFYPGKLEDILQMI